jgi:hypothetical protein
MTISTNNRRLSHFTIRRGASGVDETYDIVHRESGQVIAWLGFWEADAETKRDAQLVVRALNVFRNRGGHLVEEAFLAAVHSEPDVGAFQQQSSGASAQRPR